MHDSQAPAIVVAGLEKRYGNIHALRGASLEVRAGEIFGLLGANGAGKSTLIKTLVGVTRPDAGQVTVLGHDPVRAARLVRQQLGYMPQAPALYEDLSARENLRFFGRAFDLPDLEARIDRTLALIQLADRQHDAVHGFSGGMKQRLSLACALLHGPRLLLLDEPSAGVDPRLRESFWQFFRQQVAAGATLLVSTHQLDEAMHCDRVAIMRDGRVLACDTPRALLARGRTTVRITRADRTEEAVLHEYSRELPHLLARSGLDPAITQIEVHEESLESIVLGIISAHELAANADPTAEVAHV